MGHPEGFIEAFANLYRDFVRAIREGKAVEDTLAPGISEGLRGMRFVDCAVRGGRTWQPFKY